MAIHSGAVLAERYRVEERLGKGGMALTYAGLRLSDQLPVVIKELRFGQIPGWKSFELFQREVTTLQQLAHPAIPRYLDAFELADGSESCYYLVIERVPGQSLAQLLEASWRPGEAEVKALAIKLLDILEYLHQLAPPVIHRDLKPSNLVLDGERLYLVDFGAVQDVLRPEGSSTVVGTFGYMAPEQVLGRAVPATDLYALGATLVHILAGKAPAELPSHELRLDLRGRLNCSDALQEWLEKLLEPVWERRFQTARSAREALLHPPRRQPLKALPRPSETRVELLRTPDQLFVSIPPGPISPQTIFLAFGATVWISCVAFLTLVFARGGPWPLIGALPLWLSGIWMIQTVTRNLFLTTVLELSPRTYTLRRRLGNLYERQQQGSWDAEQMLGSQRAVRFKLTPQQSLALRLGQHQVMLGTQLTQAEQLWLQAEIQSYLRQTLPPSQSLTHGYDRLAIEPEDRNQD